MEPKFHYHIYMFLPPVPILSQINPVHVPPSHFLKVHFITVLPSISGSSKCSLSLRCLQQNPVYTSPLPHICCMPHPSHSSQFDYLNNIRCAVPIIKLLILQFPPLSCYLIPLMSKYSPQYHILKHPQPMFLPSDQ